MNVTIFTNDDGFQTTLFGAFCYFTECQLATVEMLRDKKRTSKSELKRQTTIADAMVHTIRQAIEQDASLSSQVGERTLRLPRQLLSEQKIEAFNRIMNDGKQI